MVLSVDFHAHTIYSKDSLTSPENLVKAARRRGLSRVVVTDHNSIAGAIAARKIDPDLVIVGEEIKTTRGELLAAFVTQEIPAGLEPVEVIHRLRDQGAFISVSHPFDLRSGAWSLEHLAEITPLVDTIEVFNARVMKPGANQLAQQFAKEHDLPGTAGSDAHAAFEVGAARLELPDFDGPDGLRRVIREGRVRGHVSPFWVHFFSQYARMKKEVGV